MFAYKGFEKGLICRGYQFVVGLNCTERANCAQNGFHCAEDPLDCLSYYSNMDTSEYYIVNAGGDITIHAIVNSLCELEGIESVRIMVNGSSDVMFHETTSLDTDFVFDGTYVEGEEITQTESV